MDSGKKACTIVVGKNTQIYDSIQDGANHM